MNRNVGPALYALVLSGLLSGCGISSGEALQPDPALAEVEVAGVGIDPRTQTPVVLLREPSSERIVPIWVGVPEAEAISRALNRVEMPRPMTHDLLASLVTSLGARVEEVVIHELRDGTYYGAIRLRNGARGERIEVDSRPSDGLALALRTGAAIRVARILLVDSLEEATPPEARPTV